jgi:hypothetical protein
MKPVYKIVSDLTRKGYEKGYELFEHSNGTKEWYLNGKRHREDGPAIEWSDGSKWWYLNGELHREDGPAIEHPDGSKYWWLNGEQISLKTESDDPKVKRLQEYMKLEEVLDS